MSRESNQYPVLLVKTYSILINKLDEKISSSKKELADNESNAEEKRRLERLENLRREVSKRKENSQKDIVTG